MKNTNLLIILGVALSIFLVAWVATGKHNTEDKAVDKQVINGPQETITLAGGCFWCIESAFQEEQGVLDAVSGFAGGSLEDADYTKVVQGTTEHREAVQVTYNPELISTPQILAIFWARIDPTDAGGQFADRGPQYTTAIYYHSNEQKKMAEDSLNELAESGLFDEPVATKILPLETFFEAEEYHQDYYKKAAVHYKLYEKGSGRSGFVQETWAKDAAVEFLTNLKEKEEEKAVVQPRGDYNYTEEEIANLLENLDPLAYHIVAEDGTESPFNNAYWDNKADGIYVDIVTGEPLFSSTHKYDSGTGWPSFWRSIDDESITLEEDNSLLFTRTEVRSDTGHLGHVFEDGPEEYGGRRFCINSASLSFIPKDEMEEKGYERYLHLFEE